MNISKEEVGKVIYYLKDNIGKNPKVLDIALTILQLYHDNKLVIPMEVSEIEKIIREYCESLESEICFNYKDLTKALHNSIGVKNE